MLSDIVNVSITRQTRYPTEVAFGVPLILGQHTAFVENYREYASLDEVADDFASDANEYLAAAALFNQNPSPTLIKIGKKSANVAEEVRITPTAVNSYTYQITVRGTTVYYEADASATVAEIIGGFVTALAAIDDITPTNETTYLKIVAATAGLGLSCVVGDNLSMVTQTANVGAESALTAISQDNDEFYAIICTSRTEIDVLAVAAWCESRVKFFATASSDANILLAASESDIAYLLDLRGYDRTFPLYSGDQAAFPDAGAVGVAVVHGPGTLTMKFKELNGIEPDVLTSSQKAGAKGKHANVYTTVSGIDMLEEGTMASGEFLDVIMGIDWIAATIQAEVFATLANALKIPFTNAGVDTIKAKVYAVLSRAVDMGILRADPVPTVSAPDVADISVANKAARTLPDVTFTGEIAGAVHKTTIRGTISL